MTGPTIIPGHDGGAVRPPAPARVMVLPDEPELGPQRQCIDCLEWWPDDRAFYVAWAHWHSPRCIACHQERRAASRARARSQAAARAAEREARRRRGGEVRRERARSLHDAGVPVAIVAATLRINLRTAYKWLRRSA